MNKRGLPKRSGGTRQLILALLATSAPSAVLAQDLPSQASAPDDNTIVVTAQRREEAAREVPASLTALSGEELTNQGLQQLQDLIGLVPGMTMQSSNGAGDTRLSLRGISAGGDTSQTVGMYVDDIPFGSATPFSGGSTLALELGTFDVQRIEVLRGPQGTLYGASSLGGLLKYVLQPPHRDFGVRLQAEGASTAGGGFDYALRGALNVPLAGDALALRTTGVRNHDAGFVDNVALGDENANRSLTEAGRVSLLARPADGLSLRFTGLLQGIRRNGGSSVPYDRATRRPTIGDLQQQRLVVEEFEQDLQVYSGSVEYEAGPFNVVAIAGWQKVTTNQTLDLSPVFVPIFTGIGLPLELVQADLLYQTAKTTLEVRAVSSGSGPFEWILGAFYTSEESQQGAVVDGRLAGGPFPLGSLGTPSVYKERAIYGTANYYFTPAFDVGLGLRYAGHNVRFDTVGEGIIGRSHSEVTSEDQVATYLFTARYRPGPNQLIYARVASGYRPGGPNFVLNDPVTGDPIGDESFRPDTVWNYELGAKLTLANWLDVDITGFHIDWRDIQSYVTVSGISTLANAGSAVSQGLEMAATARLAPGLSVAGTGAFIHARLSEDVPELGLSDGDRVPNVPRWSFSVATNYDFAVGAREAYLGLTWRHVGARQTLFDTTSPMQYILPAYGQIDFRAGIDFGPATLGLYVRNLFDTRGQLSAQGGGSAPTDPIEIGVTRPRTAGLILTTSF